VARELGARGQPQDVVGVVVELVAAVGDVRGDGGATMRGGSRSSPVIDRATAKNSRLRRGSSALTGSSRSSKRRRNSASVGSWPSGSPISTAR
jgi:hypothetical protein